MAYTMAAALRSNFLGNTPDGYKVSILGFLVINPILIAEVI
jgi:NhaB family Na+:H+ antiporter